MELGSGIGFTGLAVCKNCGPASYTFSDCHNQVLCRLASNIHRNLPSECDRNKHASSAQFVKCIGKGDAMQPCVDDMNLNCDKEVRTPSDDQGVWTVSSEDCMCRTSDYFQKDYSTSVTPNFWEKLPTSGSTCEVSVEDIQPEICKQCWSQACHEGSDIKEWCWRGNAALRLSQINWEAVSEAELRQVVPKMDVILAAGKYMYM